MPMVSATDIPLQPFPTGRTSPQAPSDYQQIPTSPAMFGSIQGEALQRAGQEGEKLATEVAKIGAYEQRMQDLAEVDLLAANRDDKLNKEKYGDPEAGIDPATGKPLVPGIKNMLGNDALDYIKSGAPQKAFENIVGSLASSASSERVRQMFLHQSRAQRAAYDNVIGEHWGQQLQAHNAQVLKANDVNISRRITNGYDNDAELATAINQKIDFLTRGVTDPAIRAARYYMAVTEGAGDAIKRALADNNPRRADKLLNDYKDHMDGDAVAKLYPAVRHAVDELTIAEALLPRGSAGGPSIQAADHYNTAISLGASPNEAALLTSAAGAESGFDPTKTHDGGIGYGLYGHNADRLAAMRQQFGPRPTAAQQIEFALKELRSRPEGARVNAAKTPEELTELQMKFERPAPGPTDQRATRLATTRQYMQNPPKAGGPAPVGTESAAPAAPTARSAGEAPAGTVEVWGDSLGVGLKSALKTEGTTVGGAPPTAILANIKAKPGAYWNGKTVVLSSGSNGNQMDKVEEAIDHLQSRNATVVLVGYGPKFPEKNAKLRELAQKYNARVIDAEDVAASEGVHPSPTGYASMAGKIRALRSPAIVVPPRTTAATAPPGIKEPGNFELPAAPVR